MPLNIKITERDKYVDKSRNKSKIIDDEISCVTREVLFEKFSIETQRRKISKQWDKSVLLAGLKGYKKQNIAELYECQASCLLNEHTPTRITYTIPVNNFTPRQVKDFMRKMSMPIGVSSRGFDSKSKKFFLKIKSFFISIWNKIFKKKNVETNFGGIVFPLIQRVSARTIGLDLVPVQPMSLPSGMLFYLDKKEREDVYTRVVLVEKWKPRIRYSNMTFNQDYYNPIRYDNDNMMILDGPAGR